MILSPKALLHCDRFKLAPHGFHLCQKSPYGCVLCSMSSPLCTKGCAIQWWLYTKYFFYYSCHFTIPVHLSSWYRFLFRLATCFNVIPYFMWSLNEMLYSLKNSVSERSLSNIMVMKLLVTNKECQCKIASSVCLSNS